MTTEQDQAARGLGGRAALDAYRAARVAQRGDLRAALRANREALRAARVLPGGPKAPPGEVEQAAAVLPVVVAPAAPRSVFATLVDAERALTATTPVAPPDPVPEAPVAETALVETEAVAESAPLAAMPAEEPPADPAPAEAAEVPATEPTPVEAAVVDATPVESTVVVAAVAEEPAIEAAAGMPDEAETRDDAPADDDVAVVDVATIEAAPVIDLVAEDAMPEAETPLAAIRELGPGMRHRLTQIGYHSCEDLAAADPARLAQQLGEVSRLLRPDSWISAARAACR